MDKLELKHLSPYMPFGLKMIFEGNSGRVITLTGITDQGEYGLTITSGSGAMWLKGSGFKPILRPLSDIKDSEAHHDIYCNDPKECDFHIQSILNGITKSLPYWVIEILVEYHFDVFGLIPAGLAISYKEAGL